MQPEESCVFALSTFIEPDDGGGGVGLTINVPLDVTETSPAPNALLYGLAILMLEQLGKIDEMMLAICEDGIPSEAEASRQIELLMQGQANVIQA